MAFGAETCCQKRKSYGEMGCGLGHNAGATKNAGKNQTPTTYVNICNYSTPDIVPVREKPTYILWRVYIKY